MGAFVVALVVEDSFSALPSVVLYNGALSSVTSIPNTLIKIPEWGVRTVAILFFFFS